LASSSAIVGRSNYFFKWIKQHLTTKHLFGKSKAAVVNQLFIVLITYWLWKAFSMVPRFTIKTNPKM